MDIVTCSRKEGDAKEMFASFHDVISTARLHEIVGVNSIAEGYNEGLQHCKHDIVIFTHSDVRNMASKYAIERALNFLEDKAVGFAGVAGTAILGQSGVWWQADNIDALRGAITHNDPKTNKTYQSVYGQGLFETQVAVLDGVFLLAFRKTLKDFKFWSSGFHYYDLDATLRMHMDGKINYVVDIPLLHYSLGEISNDKSWAAARAAFLDKHRNALPASVRAGKEVTA